MSEDKEEALSPEETEVNAIFTDYNSKIAQLQAKLDVINDPKHNLRLKPTFIRNEFEPKGETKAYLQKEIAILEKQAKGRAAEVAARSQPAIQGKIYEKAEVWRTQQKGQTEEKTLEESNGFVARLRARGKFGEQQKEFDTTQEKAGTPFAENKGDVTVKPSNYYSHLHFNDKDNPKLPDADKDIDVPEPEED